MIKRKLIFSLVSFFFLLAVTITVSYAWYTNIQQDDFQSPNITGYSTAAYFAGGDGSEDNPYKISNARHMYNLAWLQYLGEFNETAEDDSTKLAKQYHFTVISDEIDMTDYAVPPIGTEENPFVGVFEGNGCIIKNLIVTNDLNDLDKHPSSAKVTADNIKALSIIGMFGVIGNYEDKYSNISSIIPSVNDFYLDDILVSSIASNSLVGLLAGYVATNGNISNIGVHYSKFKLASGVTKISSFENLSSYALIGDYDSKYIGWVDKPAADGNDLAYGGNFDVNKLLNRLQLINTNKNSGSPSSYLPYIDTSSGYPLPAERQLVPLTVANDITSDVYTGSDAKEVPSSENIGYFCGNKNLINVFDIEFSTMTADYRPNDGKTYYSWEEGTTPLTFFQHNGSNSSPQTSETLNPITSEQMATLPINIQKLLDYEPGEVITVPTIRLEQRLELGEGSDAPKYSNSTGRWENGQEVYKSISYYGKTYDKVYLPNNGIWFKPKIAGKFRFVLYTDEGAQNFSLYKLTRNVTKTEGETEEEFLTRYFQSHFSGNEQVEPTQFDGTTSNKPTNLPSYNCFFYFEHEVTEAEIAANAEFALTGADNGGAYFVYLDIGVSGNTSGGATTPTYTGNISGIDFVYLDPATSVLSNIEDSSDVYFVLSGNTSAVSYFYFRRNKDAGTTIENQIYDIVLFYPGTENNGITLNYSYSGNKGKATADDCETLTGEMVEGGTVSGGYIEPTITTRYTVTFNLNGGTGTESKKVREGTAINVSDPIRLGYRFEGWYTDEACTIAYNSSAPVTSDLTLYADWYELPKYTVTYELGGGTGVVESEEIYEGFTATLGTPTRSGYVFDGWYADSSFNTEFIESTPINTDTTIYAKWIEILTVTYELDGGTGIASEDVLDGDTITVPDPTKSGYRFEGWYLDSTFTEEFNESTPITEDTILYAKWYELPKYTITFELDGGEGTSTEVVIEGEKITIPNPTKSDAYFAGWYTDEALTNKFDKSTPITEELTLYARWNDYCVTLDANGGTFSSGTTMIAEMDGDYVVLPTEQPTNSTAVNGDNSAIYAFYGWYIDSACTQAFDSNTIITENTTLYAKYEIARKMDVKIKDTTTVIGKLNVFYKIAPTAADFSRIEFTTEELREEYLNNYTCGGFVYNWGSQYIWEQLGWHHDIYVVLTAK